MLANGSVFEDHQLDSERAFHVSVHSFSCSVMTKVANTKETKGTITNKLLDSILSSLLA